MTLLDPPTPPEKKTEYMLHDRSNDTVKSQRQLIARVRHVARASTTLDSFLNSALAST